MGLLSGGLTVSADSLTNFSNLYRSQLELQQLSQFNNQQDRRAALNQYQMQVQQMLNSSSYETLGLPPQTNKSWLDSEVGKYRFKL